MSKNAENSSKVSAGPDVEYGNPGLTQRKSPSPARREEYIEQAVEDFESPLIAYASTILNDIDLARDVVQETFIRLCQQDLSKVEKGLKSWLFTVCRNRSFDILRKSKRSQAWDELQWKTLPGPGLQPDEQADQQELFSQLHVYLQRLHTNQRDVILLKFQQGLSYREIQEITGLPSGTIGFLIHSGLKRLREIIPADLRS